MASTVARIVSASAVLWRLNLSCGRLVMTPTRYRTEPRIPRWSRWPAGRDAVREGPALTAPSPPVRPAPAILHRLPRFGHQRHASTLLVARCREPGYVAADQRQPARHGTVRLLHSACLVRVALSPRVQ